jgi:hypothetical protein
VKLADAQARVILRLLSMPKPPSERELVATVVKLSIESVGFHFADDGEICDPRPNQTWIPPGQEAKWGGGSRRRRSGR